MFGKFFSALQGHRSNENMLTRRHFSRRRCDKCVSMIGEKLYPVEDWSPGGILIRGDGRAFNTGSEIDVTMKFKLRNDMLDIPHRARVIRKTQDKVAFEFLPLPRQIHRNFQSVIDDYLASGFAESHIG